MSEQRANCQTSAAFAAHPVVYATSRDWAPWEGDAAARLCSPGPTFAEWLAADNAAARPTEFPEKLSAAFLAQLPPGLDHDVGNLDQLHSEGLRRFLGRRVASGRGLRSTATILTFVYVFSLRFGGYSLIDVSEVARATGFTRPTVYKALRYVAAPKVGRPKLERVAPRSTGPRRPGKWALREGIVPTLAELHAAGESARVRQLRARCKANVDKENYQTSRHTSGPDSLNCLSSQGTAAPCTPTRTTEPQDLLRWLDSSSLDLDRVPLFGERRKMAAALHLSAVDRRIADVTLDGLMWRRSLPIKVWRSAIQGLVKSGEQFVRPEPPVTSHRNGFLVLTIAAEPPPDHWSKQTRTELEWRARLAVKHLAAHPADVAMFRRTLELGPPPTFDSLNARIEAVRLELTALVDGVYSGPDFRHPKCPKCRMPVRLSPDHCTLFDNYKQVSDHPNMGSNMYRTETGPHRCHTRLVDLLTHLTQQKARAAVAPSTPVSGSVGRLRSSPRPVKVV